MARATAQGGHERLRTWLRDDPPQVAMATVAAGEDPAANRSMVEFANRSTRITGVHAAQAVTAAPGYLHSIIVGTPVTGKTITIKDGPSGAVISLITCSGAIPFSLHFGTRFAVGLEVTPNDDGIDLTVVWR